jgi:nucleoside 2-deoxyribosyltransferase
MNYTVYLAGPITGLTYGNATEWRKLVKDAMPSHISTLSPMRGKQRLELLKDEQIKMSYEDNPLTSEKGINTRDYYDVMRCDALFVNLLGAQKVSIGTVMEIAWARTTQKPVILVMEKGNVHDHAMLRYACGFIVSTLEEGIEVLKTVIGPDEKIEI